jgi:hypothetical protein
MKLFSEVDYKIVASKQLMEELLSNDCHREVIFQFHDSLKSHLKMLEFGAVNTNTALNQPLLPLLNKIIASERMRDNNSNRSAHAFTELAEFSLNPRR